MEVSVFISQQMIQNTLIYRAEKRCLRGCLLCCHSPSLCHSCRFDPQLPELLIEIFRVRIHGGSVEWIFRSSCPQVGQVVMSPRVAWPCSRKLASLLLQDGVFWCRPPRSPPDGQPVSIQIVFVVQQGLALLDHVLCTLVSGSPLTRGKEGCKKSKKPPDPPCRMHACLFPPIISLIGSLFLQSINQILVLHLSILDLTFFQAHELIQHLLRWLGGYSNHSQHYIRNIRSAWIFSSHVLEFPILSASIKTTLQLHLCRTLDWLGGQSSRQGF